VISLSGSDSDGTIAGYAVTAQPTNGTLSGTGSTRTYTPKPGFTGRDSFAFTVTDNAGGVSAPAAVSITVTAKNPVNQVPVACFNVTTANPTAGQPVQFNASCSTDADGDALTYSWNFGNSTSGTGVQPSRTFANAGTYVVSVTASDGKGGTNTATKNVTVAPVSTGGGSCAFAIDNHWNDGFTATITIKNNGTTPINGWNVGWGFSDGSTITGAWNAVLSGTNPYTATGVSWNSVIAPGQSVSFGFQGKKAVKNNPPPTATVTGAVCK
jgi:hypothetical protein